MKGKQNSYLYGLVVVILISLLVAPSAMAQPSKRWEVEFHNFGTHSSPRAADLNGDGVKDLIIGCSKKEFEQNDTAIIAVDGATGKVIWTVSARDQVYGSAALLDINHDSVPDIIIGGRAAELQAINGKNGKVIWAFYPNGNSREPRKKGWFNFYNPQVIPDQNNDGLEDILVTNGGDILAAPYDPNRPTGKILVLDGGNGKILAEVNVPDGKETYMSLVISKLSGSDKDFTIIFGTGGETIGGNLYRTTLKDVMKQDISTAKLLASSKDKGFIAPPVLCDLNLDGYLDIVVNAVEGNAIAIDGKTNNILWKNGIKNAEAYGSLAVGYYNNDSIPDLFTTFTEGTWPNLKNSKQIMFDGRTGKIEFLDSLGVLQTSSPVITDFNNDGYDDGLVCINFIVMEKEIFRTYYNMLVIYDFHKESTFQLTTEIPGINLSSTPWIGDLDNDGKIDIVYCFLTDARSESSMNGFKMVRLSLDSEIKKPVRWGAYMGSNYDGIFR
ncbi:MAG: PQQ-binding-like beta-propeller repeat protein [Ferruginibacter sp.]